MKLTRLCIFAKRDANLVDGFGSFPEPDRMGSPQPSEAVWVCDGKPLVLTVFSILVQSTCSVMNRILPESSW
jgi:hypothetical protein